MLFFGIIFGMLITAMMYAAYVVILAFIIWMAIDAGKQDRFWWMVLIVGIPLIGALMYFFTEKKHEYAKVPVRRVHESETEHQHEQAPHKHHQQGDHLANKE